VSAYVVVQVTVVSCEPGYMERAYYFIFMCLVTYGLLHPYLSNILDVRFLVMESYQKFGARTYVYLPVT